LGCLHEEWDKVSGELGEFAMIDKKYFTDMYDRLAQNRRKDNK